MGRTWKNNSLSIVAAVLFVFTFVGHSLTGWAAHNQEEKDHGQPPAGFVEYLSTGSFLESVFENWESEFLQMGLFVLITAMLVQKGAAESKTPEGEEGAGEDPQSKDPRKHRNDPHAPWPVRRGGVVLDIYQNSLSLAFLLLFVATFVAHGLSGAADYNDEQKEHGGKTIAPMAYFAYPRFWFESFQNWQSEFLSVLSVVGFSIWLRQRGSPESKPVHAPHEKTGTD